MIQLYAINLCFLLKINWSNFFFRNPKDPNLFFIKSAANSCFGFNCLNSISWFKYEFYFYKILQVIWKKQGLYELLSANNHYHLFCLLSIFLKPIGFLCHLLPRDFYLIIPFEFKLKFDCSTLFFLLQMIGELYFRVTAPFHY
jgi:hypothetical protein